MDEALPPALAAALRPVLPELAESIIAAIGSEVPEYRRPLEGPFGRALRVGVEQALARFVEQIEHPEADDEATREIYVSLGRGEMRAGRSLDALLSAYRLGAGALTVAEEGLTIGFGPDPEGPRRREQIEAALDGTPAALGPSVALGRAHHSLARARAAHALALEGRLAADGLVIADEHLPALLLHAGDAALAADLATRALAPLAALKPGARSRLEPTLRSWLDHPGQVQRIAAELPVHPQ